MSITNKEFQQHIDLFLDDKIKEEDVINTFKRFILEVMKFYKKVVPDKDIIDEIVAICLEKLDVYDNKKINANAVAFFSTIILCRLRHICRRNIVR